MFIYFVSITYGIYFSTTVDFILYNNSLCVKYIKSEDRLDYYGRSCWGIYDIDLQLNRGYYTYIETNPHTSPKFTKLN